METFITIAIVIVTVALASHIQAAYQTWMRQKKEDAVPVTGTVLEERIIKKEGECFQLSLVNVTRGDNQYRGVMLVPVNYSGHPCGKKKFFPDKGLPEVISMILQ